VQSFYFTPFFACAVFNVWLFSRFSFFFIFRFVFVLQLATADAGVAELTSALHTRGMTALTRRCAQLESELATLSADLFAAKSDAAAAAAAATMTAEVADRKLQAAAAAATAAAAAATAAAADAAAAVTEAGATAPAEAQSVAAAEVASAIAESRRATAALTDATTLAAAMAESNDNEQRRLNDVVKRLTDELKTSRAQLAAAAAATASAVVSSHEHSAATATDELALHSQTNDLSMEMKTPAEVISACADDDGDKNAVHNADGDAENQNVDGGSEKIVSTNVDNDSAPVCVTNDVRVQRKANETTIDIGTVRTELAATKVTLADAEESVAALRSNADRLHGDAADAAAAHAREKRKWNEVGECGTACTRRHFIGIFTLLYTTRFRFTCDAIFCSARAHESKGSYNIFESHAFHYAQFGSTAWHNVLQ
jgi:hypothetical protein